MFCNYCGKELTENAIFCPFCGKETAKNRENDAQIPTNLASGGETAVNTPTPSEDTASVPTEEVAGAVVQEAPAASETPFAEDSPVSKKKKKLWPMLVIGVILAVIAILAACFWPTLKGFYLRNFAKPEEYLNYVKTLAFEKSNEQIVDVYNEYLENATKDVAATSSVKLSVSEDVQKLLATSLGGNFDMKWLDGITLAANSNKKGSDVATDLALKIQDVDVLTAKLLLASSKEKMYMALPSLSEKNLYFDFDKLGEGFTESTLAGNDTELIKLLPSDEELLSILNRYEVLLLENIKKVEKSQETQTVEGIEENLTVLKATLTAEDIRDIFAVLTEKLKNDEEVKAILIRIGAYANKKEYTTQTAEEIYKTFQAGVDDFYDGIKEGLSDNEGTLYCKTYITDTHQIVGRVIENKDEKLLSFFTLQKGTEVGMTVTIGEDDFKISGKLTYADSKLSGTFLATFDGTEAYNVTVKDLAVKDKDDAISGTIVFTPTESFTKALNLGSEAEQYVKDQQLAFSLEFTGNQKRANCKIDITSKNGVLFGVTVDTETKETTDISVPADSDCLDGLDDTAMQAWLMSMDAQALLENLQKAGIPTELLQMLFM